MFNMFKKAAPETRAATIENPTVPVSASNFMEFFGQVGGPEHVTVEKALGVPAVWAAVNFLSGTLAGLPLSVYKRGENGREKVSGGIADILHDAVNDETTSFQWRKQLFDSVFTLGRSYSCIERDARDNVVNLWFLPVGQTKVRRVSGRRFYDYSERGHSVTYVASEIIDIPMMLKPDGVGHYHPIMTHKDVIGLAIAITKYGSRFFSGGGIPPFAIEGPMKTATGVDKAGRDLTTAVKEAAQDNRIAIAMPDGHKLTPLGVDPEKMQMIEAQRFVIEQIARIYSLPMVFLQDLTRGTFSNTEQQDLHLVKHTIKRWVEQFEQELNLKLFGRGNREFYVRFNMDGLLRGDFKSRIEGLSRAIQTALMKPNEGRALLELPDDPDGDLLMIQGATIPVRNAKAAQPSTTPPKEVKDNDDQA